MTRTSWWALAVTEITVASLAIGGAFVVWEDKLADQVESNVTVTKIDKDVTLVTIQENPDEIAVIDTRQTGDDRVRVTRIHRNPDTTAKPSTKPTKQAAKWTLPYTCEDVKYYHAKFNAAQLEALRVAARLPHATPGEMVQINECLASK